MRIITVLFIFTSLFSKAQQFDHVTIYVSNLKTERSFYDSVMHFESVQNPYKDTATAWFKTGDHSQLHVVSGAGAITGHEMTVHMAFKVDNIELFLGRLIAFGIPWYSALDEKNKITLRPDGVKQIYLQDPEGYWIEINNSKY